jgi:ribosomal protein L11 methyltransferase
VNTWLKVTAHLSETPEDWSRWTERFAEVGIEGTVQTDDPPTLSAYLPPGEESKLPALSALLAGLGAEVTTEDVEEVDWSEAWRQFFKPMKIGKRIWLRPSWEEAETPQGRIEIVLDPGQAFGTGDHPTTRLCLELLESQVLEGMTVADIGCGSGILSIAAAKLGAARVDAVDVDAVSVQATRENADRNAVSVGVYEGTGFDPLGESVYDVVVSNIISAAVIGLAARSSRRVKKGGTWIVSGIIEPNWPDVYEHVTRSGFRVAEWRKEGDWVAATLLH